MFNHSYKKHPTLGLMGQYFRNLLGVSPMVKRVAKNQSGPTQHALDRWNSAHYLELFLNYDSFPFSSLFLPSRTPQGHNASRWAFEGL